jgi:hypothetical protein
VGGEERRHCIGRKGYKDDQGECPDTVNLIRWFSAGRWAAVEVDGVGGAVILKAI